MWHGRTSKPTGYQYYTREERGGDVSEKAKFTITEKLKLQVITEKLKLQVCMRAREGKGERGPRGVWKV